MFYGSVLFSRFFTLFEFPCSHFSPSLRSNVKLTPFTSISRLCALFRAF